ncbi:MAG TPA: aminotransferase class V-fold PLP-dependent enzyme [Acidobacteriota bacterium]|nr:aminotransferase class V-fold PLP-dependent enzyme [Acidobacteriota bacterium]
MEIQQDLSKFIYLDNAATTYPKPKEVLQQALDFFASYGVNPGRSGFDLCVYAGEMVHKTRKELAEFFGGSNPDYLTFAYNASDALNIIIQGILRDGDHAISTTVEHNSVIRPLNHLREEKGVEVDYVPVGEDFQVDPQEIASRFRDNTRLVIVNHGSNVIGAIQPVAKIGALCRERGVYFAIDTAQTAGVIPIDVEAMNVDALAFTGHKSLLGPTGIGGVWVREGIDIRATRAGGTGVRSAYPMHLDEFPYRLEVGTCNLFGIAALHYAQEYIAERGLDNIHKHEMELFRRLYEGISEIEGVTIYGPATAEGRLPVLSFNVVNREATDVGTLLDVEYDIATRTGLHCAPLIHEQLGTGKHGSVRMSIGPMNEMKDVEAGIAAIAEIARDALD